PVALDELGTVMHKKKAFIVTDTFLYKSGFTKKIEVELDAMGIAHASFWDVTPDPTLQCAQQGLRQMQSFEPDCIIAIGGGSAMDCAKIMWMMYEHPEARFEDMAVDFMDIRKRIYTFPKLGEKVFFVAIPTSSGTGSEVTPFAIITDAETGVKWPIADYELLPDMAIVDTDNMMSQPRGLTSASGVDVLTHALEAFVSVMSSDYTDGLALRAMKLVFDYLPRAYDKPDDVEARDHMANASCLAGMAFANAFLGVNHSMAHKLGAWHHIPHGWANAVILTRVMRYNSAERPTKMGTFPQYDHPKTLARYAEAARFCGVTGADDAEVFEKFLVKIGELLDHVGVHRTIAEYGVDEQYFLDNLDEMSEQAFNDQCTGANPRYPLISEIRELYLDAYYGREPSSYED
ncbi:MAG: iron-containing alcohol dehydrogenase, partial [Atopobiaceae bacterium]|nr:iron-containing alcohol dehydrogenase [Atopobiaceae bacterium]